MVGLCGARGVAAPPVAVPAKLTEPDGAPVRSLGTVACTVMDQSTRKERASTILAWIQASHK